VVPRLFGNPHPPPPCGKAAWAGAAPSRSPTAPARPHLARRGAASPRFSRILRKATRRHPPSRRAAKRPPPASRRRCLSARCRNPSASARARPGASESPASWAACTCASSVPHSCSACALKCSRRASTAPAHTSSSGSDSGVTDSMSPISRTTSAPSRRSTLPRSFGEGVHPIECEPRKMLGLGAFRCRVMMWFRFVWVRKDRKRYGPTLLGAASAGYHRASQLVE